MGISNISALKGGFYFKDLKGKKETPKEDSEDEIKKVPKKFPAKKRQKPVKKRSKKQAITMKQLRTLYPVYLEAHPVCNINSPVCIQTATCVNHTKGRGVKEVLDQSSWEPACDPCNSYIESHHAWAEEHGHKKMRHGKIERP